MAEESSQLAQQLRGVIRGEVDDSPQTLEGAARDASLFYVRPAVVVRPMDAADICALVTFVNGEKKKNPKSTLSLTARSAGTDMSGGPLTDSIVVDMTAHLNKLVELGADPDDPVGAGYAVVEPGMYFRDFDKETKKKDLELPSYTASRELNTVGGMAANNSGGEKNLKYGKTARYVQELDVVLADGKVHTLSAHGEDELRAQMQALVSSNKAVIEEHKPQVEKNSSGYALWDMGEPINLARIMVGAQGTLGIITKIRYKLVHPKPYAAMTVIFVKNLSQLGELVPEVLKYSPDSFESYDDHTFAIALKYLPELGKQMKAGLISLGLSFLPELWMMVTGGIPKLVLIVEFRADTQGEALQRAEALATEVRRNAAHEKVHVAPDEAHARKYWAIRRESFNLLRKKVRGKRTAPFIDDFVVPPATLPEFLPKLQAIMSEYKNLTYTVAGHVGDGNFHIIPLVDPHDPTLAKTIDELSHRVYDLVVQYQGSITGEHNDGLIRTPYVEKMFGAQMMGLFMEVKKMFDPLNIFNPGKKVGTTFSDALAKLDLPKQK